MSSRVKECNKELISASERMVRGIVTGVYVYIYVMESVSNTTWDKWRCFRGLHG